MNAFGELVKQRGHVSEADAGAVQRKAGANLRPASSRPCAHGLGIRLTSNHRSTGAIDE
jgi:hypothetical protein